MSDRRMICLMFVLASLSLFLYAHYDIVFGPRLTTQLEEYLELPHLFVAFSIVIGALVVLVYGIVCVNTKDKERDE